MQQGASPRAGSDCAEGFGSRRGGGLLRQPGSAYAEYSNELPVVLCRNAAQSIDHSRTSPELETSMSNHVYKQIELVGSSSKSTDDAIAKAIARASKTLRNLDWFEVTEVRGHIKNGKVEHWQVGLKIGMRLDGKDE